MSAPEASAAPGASAPSGVAFVDCDLNGGPAPAGQPRRRAGRSGAIGVTFPDRYRP